MDQTPQRKGDQGFSPWRALALAAIAAGLLRIASSFIEWDAQSIGLEALALIIDLGLLFGLAGLYFANAARLGALGLVGFFIAAAGIALITGPDGEAFGVNIYNAGVNTIALGLVIFSIVLLRQSIAKPAAALWLASTVVGAGGSVIGLSGAGFMLAGILFGLGFVAAGVTLIHHK